MAPVAQYVAVYRDGQVYDCELYRRVVDMAFMPALEDQVSIWRGVDEGDGDYHRVKRRYFTNDGRACIELAGIMIDPPPDWSSRYMAAHYTRTGGDPVARLLASGWEEV